MKNTFGQSLTVTLFGESHGKAIGAVVDGIASGIDVNEKTIAEFLSRRRPNDCLSTSRVENDGFEIVSGVFNGKTCGTPLTVIIKNESIDSSSYEYGIARPSHADYVGSAKYHGFEDYRGGGHFSGRLTAAIVAVGGILLPQLNKLGIEIGTHILSCGNAFDRHFDAFEADLAALKNSVFPTLDKHAESSIKAEIKKAGDEGDSVGGKTETTVIGLPEGLGEPYFDSIESVLAHAMLSLGGIKGIEFGRGFECAGMRGSDFNDSFLIKDNKIVTATNNNGGINGGITNGMPVTFCCAVKPTPSIALTQKTVDFIKKKNREIAINGRHDPAIIRRICPIIDSLTAIVVSDILACRYGTDVLSGRIKWNTD